MDENPHQNHRARMRARFISQGLSGFAPHEALEMLLYYCYPRQDTNAVAHRMIARFGSIHNLFDADVNDIMNQCGCTENVAVLVGLIPQLAAVYLRDKRGQKPALCDGQSAAAYAMALFVGRSEEALYMLCLDTQRRLNHASLLAEGGLNETVAHPRTVMEQALRHKAASVVLAHNHPGGAAHPSPADIAVTRRIAEGLAFIDVAVLDHIVTAGDQYYSFAAHGQTVAGYGGP